MMGGSQGGYGQLAQSANPQVADPMQNQNRLGFPNGRRIMGGGQGYSQGPAQGPGQMKPPDRAMTKPGGSNPLGYGEGGRMGTAKPMPKPVDPDMFRGQPLPYFPGGGQPQPGFRNRDAMIGPDGRVIGRDANNQFPGSGRIPGRGGGGIISPEYQRFLEDTKGTNYAQDFVTQPDGSMISRQALAFQEWQNRNREGGAKPMPKPMIQGNPGQMDLWQDFMRQMQGRGGGMMTQPGPRPGGGK